VARIAELFSEEDLARHLQIMLRTHNELGYRQEQRFHLELGLLKMVHAQRLIPIEQLLSEMSTAAAPGASRLSRPQVESRGAPSLSQARASSVSPFAADSARKGGSKPELSADTSGGIGPRIVANATPTTPVILGSVAHEPASVPDPARVVALEQAPVAAPQADLDQIRNAILNALGDAGHRMLVSMLETGEWAVEGNEIVIKVASTAAVIDMSLGAEAKRVAIASASGAAGRPLKLKVLPGGTAQAAPARVSTASNGGGRARAEQEPIVRRLREKFGAEIRTIIDQRDKK
jgi:DNA polymerase-3 subunit gamma/tau